VCMKYEKEYGPCFDEMEDWGFNKERSLINFLGHFNIHVDKKEMPDIKYEIFKALELCHETGAIRPMTKEEKEEFYENDESYRISDAMTVVAVHKEEFDRRMKHWEDGTLGTYLEDKKVDNK